MKPFVPAPTGADRYRLLVGPRKLVQRLASLFEQ